MTMSSRQRSKYARKAYLEAKQQHINDLSRIVEANLLTTDKGTDFASRMAKSAGPARYDAKPASTSRERLKAGSYGVGFQGPRGFASPRDLVGKKESDGERLGSSSRRDDVTPRPSNANHPKSGCKAGSKRFAGDTQVGALDLGGYDYAVPSPIEEKVKRKMEKEKHWKSVG